MQPDEIFPFLLGMLVFLIPIIAILTSHQQKMAKIIRERETGQGEAQELMALRAELNRLTQAVHQNTIAIDTLIQSQSVPPGPMHATTQPPVFTRLEN